MQKTASIRSIMQEFSVSTGLIDAVRAPRRYLWTDAFAVCNYLELYHQTADADFLEIALKLIDQVHHTLGQYHKESVRKGRISGLDGEEAFRHPTIGGLRIGKQMNEREPGEPFDERLEWERDGQYFHYLTKWMHALNAVSRVTEKGIYNQWALELARTAHVAFTYTPKGGGPKRMFWKMSIDLSRPLVDSMGQHDPLDGLMTYLQLEATAQTFTDTPAALSLKSEIEALTAMCAGHHWVTEDPLGIGGLLTDACKLTQLIDSYHLDETTRLEALLHDCESSLRVFASKNSLHLPAEQRLAFRESGLAIGLHGVDRMQTKIEQHPDSFTNVKQLSATLLELSRYVPVAKNIDNFWLELNHRSNNTWLAHTDINGVMLATSLAPNSYLTL